MRHISILGSGWLGLPLAEHLLAGGNAVKLSTRSPNRVAELYATGAEAFVVNIESLTDGIQPFLQADILIVNITSKNIAAFQQLISQIEASPIEKVIFVSSTSVYRNVDRTLTEADLDFHSDSPLLVIEDLFRNSGKFATTVLRFGGLFGYSRHPGRFFRSGKTVQNPDSPVNLIHRDDCIEIIDRIVGRGIWGEVLNACADTHPSKRAFYTRAVNAMGGSLPEFGTTDPEVGKVISNRKLKRLLDFELRHADLMNVEFEAIDDAR